MRQLWLLGNPSSWWVKENSFLGLTTQQLCNTNVKHLLSVLTKSPSVFSEYNDLQQPPTQTQEKIRTLSTVKLTHLVPANSLPVDHPQQLSQPLVQVISRDAVVSSNTVNVDCGWILVRRGLKNILRYHLCSASVTHLLCTRLHQGPHHHPGYTHSLSPNMHRPKCCPN